MHSIKNNTILFIVTSFLTIGLFAVGGYAFAHGGGASEEATVDGYLVDIGLSAETFTARDLSRFDFSLIDEETGEDVPFSDVWVRIHQGQKVFLATGVHRPELGQTGVSYAFPEKGEYQVSVRYQNDGNSIAEHSFPVTVAAGAEGGEKGNAKMLGLLLLIAVAGLAIGFFVGKKRAV